MRFIIIFLLILISSLLIHLYNSFESFNYDESYPPASIIYFAYLKKDRWPDIVVPQINDLIKNELLNYITDLHICLSGEKEEIIQAESQLKEILDQYLDKVQFHHTYENLYEYPGIKKLYDEGIKHPDRIFLYFHSKGMVFHENNKERNVDELALFKTVIHSWRQVLERFMNKDINKVTFGCSETGVGYYNFFWVRGQYFQRCNSPKITENRYYYETYLAEDCNNNTPAECHSLVGDDPTTCYTNPQILGEMSKIHSQLDSDPDAARST